MLTAKFRVGKDDLPLGLTFGDIESLVKPICDESESPLSLQFRILPDLSALKHDTRKLQPFKTNGDWYYAIIHSLSCYTSLTYRGYGSAIAYDNYSTGSPLWSISAHYSYRIPEAEAVPNSNRPFMRHGRSVYYRTEQPGKTYDLEYVEIKDSPRSLEKFLTIFAELNTRFAQVDTWVEQRLDAEAICECGHRGRIDHLSLSRLMSRLDTIASLKPYLTCTSCKRSSVIAVMPLYSRSTPQKYIHKTAWTTSERRRTEPPPVARDSEGEEMYNALGGDGETAVYLSDGAYLSPTGEIFED